MLECVAPERTDGFVGEVPVQVTLNGQRHDTGLGSFTYFNSRLDHERQMWHMFYRALAL